MERREERKGKGRRGIETNIYSWKLRKENKYPEGKNTKKNTKKKKTRQENKKTSKQAGRQAGKQGRWD